MKPYITEWIYPGREFQVTDVTIDIDMTPGGDLFYCVVGKDENHSKNVNLIGRRSLEDAIGYLVPIIRALVRVREEEARKQWKKENEEE